MFASITTIIKIIVKINGMHRYVYVLEALKTFICSDPEKQVLFKNMEKSVKIFVSDIGGEVRNLYCCDFKANSLRQLT